MHPRRGYETRLNIDLAGLWCRMRYPDAIRDSISRVETEPAKTTCTLLHEMKLPKWDPKRIHAAKLVAEDVLTDDAIAKEVGVCRRTLANWKETEAFRDRVNSIRGEIEKRILSSGIARKGLRVQEYEIRWKRMRKLLNSRASDPTMMRVPGGDTGLLVRRFKQIGVELVEEYHVDTGLLKAMLDLEKQASIEVGDWQERQDLTTGGGQIGGASVVVVELPDNGRNDR